MPRFGRSMFDSSVDDPLGFQQNANKKTATLNKHLSQLICLSPNHLAVNLVNNNCIETHSLPLRGTSEEEESLNNPAKACIRTSLSKISDEEWIELICVEGESMPKREYKEDGLWTVLPLLCLYSRHSIYLLKIGYPHERESSGEEIIEGRIMEITQPFQSKLLEYGDGAKVVRVRSAPFRRLGFATACPSGSMAALISCATGTNECQLCIYHGGKKEVTQPLDNLSSQHYGDVLEEEGTQEFVDFNFGQSNSSTLLVTLSVHLLKSNGEVWGASPILFDGSMVPTHEYQASCDILDEMYNESFDESRRRQCHAAEFFVQQAFVEVHQQGNRQPSHHIAVLHAGDPNRSTLWPVSLQGPLFTLNNEESTATSMEPFFSRDLVGIALASTSGIDLCALAPTALLPRFAFEEMGEHLDAQLKSLCWVVEHVSLEGANTSTCRLMQDPLMDTMLHCITDRGVMTLTTYALRQASSQITKGASKGRVINSTSPPTKAWMGVELSQQSDACVSGAVVSSAAHLGHILIVYLSSGELTAVNLTETHVRYESKHMLEQERINQPKPNSASAVKALQNMEATPAFHEQLETIWGKIEAGLLGMSKISGSSTQTRDIDAGLLATSLNIKQHCEQNVVVHLKYMKELQSIRLKEMKKIIAGQMEQLKSIQGSLKKCKSRFEASQSKMRVTEEKSRSLAGRSEGMLQASLDLRPSLSQADLRYFALLKRTNTQCEDWEAQVENLQQSAGGYNYRPLSFKLTPVEMRHIQTLLTQQNEVITQTTHRVKETETTLKVVVNDAGIVTKEAEFEGFPSPSGGE